MLERLVEDQFLSELPDMPVAIYDEIAGLAQWTARR